jgi:LmbE family N-acetylglucosaminyl deacetylase
MDKKIALALCAHPDDAEFMCTGTLALLYQKGWQIHIATMTPGDCGTIELSRKEISNVRRVEAAASAALLGGRYHCLEFDDVFVMYDKPTLLKAIKVIRQVRPLLVFAPSPNDYMGDHENTSRVVWNACFAAGIPNVKTPGAKIFEHVPHLYYADPLDAKDNLGNLVKASCYVDVSSQMVLKEKMLCCHASQRNWLMAHHGVDEYTAAMKRHDKMRGQEIGVEYAEAFRQHLGHAFPQDNLLKEELGKMIYTK